MTKPVGFFVSGQSIDLLIGVYGSYLEKLSKRQLIHLLFLVVDQVLESSRDEDENDVSADNAFVLVEKVCNSTADTAFGLMEAIIHQLRYPLEKPSSSVEVAGLPVEIQQQERAIGS